MLSNISSFSQLLGRLTKDTRVTEGPLSALGSVLRDCGRGQKQGSALRGFMLASESQSHSPVKQPFLPSAAAAREASRSLCGRRLSDPSSFPSRCLWTPEGQRVDKTPTQSETGDTAHLDYHERAFYNAW